MQPSPGDGERGKKGCKTKYNAEWAVFIDIKPKGENINGKENEGGEK